MSDDNVFYANDSDETMNRAMDKARETIGYFEKSLHDPQPGQWSFSAKVGLQDGDIREHLWLGDVKIDEDGAVYGTVSNEPVNLTNVSLGAKVLVKGEDISDWMIIERGRLIGGYTVRVYRDQLDEAARADFDQSLGLVVDEGIDHFIHDFTTPEGAILCLEDAYSNGDVDAAVNCKDFLREATHLLGRIPNMPADPNIVRSTAETLEMAFREHISNGGMPDFSEVERAFPLREYEDAYTVMVTEVCFLPDGNKTLDKIWVYKVGEEWKVGPPANEDL